MTQTFGTLTGDVSYKAKYNQTLNQYTYTFYEEDGTTPIATDTVDYGTEITAPADPTKAATAEYTYTFDGWYVGTEKVTDFTVTGDVEYVAKFTAVKNKYLVTFYDENGTTELYKAEFEYGTTPVFDVSKTPTKAQDETYYYTFDGWTETLAEVTGATSYTAKYKATYREYLVTFDNGATYSSLKF